MWFRKSLAVLLLIIALPVINLTIGLFLVDRTVFQADFWTSRFEGERITEQLVTAIPGMLVIAFAQGQGEAKLPFRTSELEAALADQGLEPIFRNYFNRTIQETLRYVKSETETFDLELDLAELKTKVVTALETAISRHLENLPPCTPEQLKALQAAPDKLDCRPADATGQQIQQMFSQGLREQASILPDSYNLNQLVKSSNQSHWEAARRAYEFVRLGERAGLIASGLILLLVTLLIWKPWTAVVRWLATAFIFPTLLILGLGTVAALAGLFLRGYLQILPKEFKPIGISAIEAVFGGLRNQFLLAGAVMAGAIILGYLLTRITKRREAIAAPVSKPNYLVSRK